MLSLITSRKIPEIKPVDIDTNFSLVRCIAGKKNRTTRVGKAYKSLESILLHTERCSDFGKSKEKECPKRDEVISAIKRTQEEYGKDAPVHFVPEFHEWGVLVK